MCSKVFSCVKACIRVVPSKVDQVGRVVVCLVFLEVAVCRAICGGGRGREDVRHDVYDVYDGRRVCGGEGRQDDACGGACANAVFQTCVIFVLIWQALS